MPGILINGKSLFSPVNQQLVRKGWSSIEGFLTEFFTEETRWQKGIDWFSFFQNYENRSFKAELFGAGNELIGLDYLDKPKGEQILATSIMMVQLQQFSKFSELVDYFMQQACFQPSLGAKTLSFLLHLANSAIFAEFSTANRFMHQLARYYFEYLREMLGMMKPSDYYGSAPKLMGAIDEVFGFWIEYLNHCDTEMVDKTFKIAAMKDILGFAQELEQTIQDLGENQIISFGNKDNKMRKLLKLVGSEFVKMRVPRKFYHEYLEKESGKFPIVSHSFFLGIINGAATTNTGVLAKFMVQIIICHLPIR